MSRPLVSVVMATYNRAHLLKRSLIAYENQEFDNERMELIVIDDHSTDTTRDLVLDWSHTFGIKATVLTPSPKMQSWRDCGAVLNCGIRASSGEHIILTHPEVIPGRRSVVECVEKLVEFEGDRVWKKETNEDTGEYGIYNTPGYLFGLYACCRVYYLSPRDQERLDSVRWKEEGNLAVRQIPGFYDDDDNAAPDFTHIATDNVSQPGSRLRTWESWVFGGVSRETMKRMGGMLETQKWGSVDVAFMARRKTLGIPNYTCSEDQTIVIHQCHNMPNDIPTPREEETWKRELASVDLTNGIKMCYPETDFLGWG